MRPYVTSATDSEFTSDNSWDEQTPSGSNANKPSTNVESSSIERDIETVNALAAYGSRDEYHEGVNKLLRNLKAKLDGVRSSEAGNASATERSDTSANENDGGMIEPMSASATARVEALLNSAPVCSSESAEQTDTTDMSVETAMKLMGVNALSRITYNKLLKQFKQRAPEYASFMLEEVRDLAIAFDTLANHLTYTNGWNKDFVWTPKKDAQLLAMKENDPYMEFDFIAHVMDTTTEECETRFKFITRKACMPQHVFEQSDKQANSNSAKVEKKKVTFKSKNPDAGYWGGVALDRPADNVSRWVADGVVRPRNEWINSNFPHASRGKNVDSCKYATPYGPASMSAGVAADPLTTPSYTVTYRATVKSGNQELHIPIDADNVCGSEKVIIENNNGLEKVWKWVHDNGLAGKIGLEQAYDLALSMHGGESAAAVHDNEAKIDGSAVGASAGGRGLRSTYDYCPGSMTPRFGGA
ncbi:hypothetical protein J1614_000870 [Plenodomus biglobosus]|nr:hypothetical protein J1614_000870 [Plenodomus biglobosus]